MKSSKKLIFFGNEKLATGVTTSHQVSQSLIEAGYEIVAIITDSKLEKAINSDIEAAILVAYGQIIPQKVLNIFPKGIINIHPSLLPLYRGSSPIEQAILDGASETGVSLMKLTAKMDAGPVFAQAKLKLNGNETKQEITDKLLSLGAQTLISELPKILDGFKKPASQNNKLATYTNKIQKSDGSIDFNKSAEQLEREVRAYAGWPRSQAKVYNKEIIITKAKIAKNESDGELVIKCNPGWLEIQELIAPSGRTISGADFVRGYSKRS